MQTGWETSIQGMNQHNIRDAGKCDGTFIIDSRLVLSTDGRDIQYTSTPIEPYSKKYPSEAINYNDYIDNPERIVYLAFVDDIPAGEIRLRKNWNRFAYVEDIVVDVNFRRRGIGRMLLEKAIEWAKGVSLPGIMLETQNNNVAACALYSSCGFELAGFDRHLYHGIDPQTDEIALYWYLVFKPGGEHQEDEKR